MLEIFAQSMMIATRMDGKVWVRDVKIHDEKRRADQYFWQGRKWREIDPNKL